MDNVNKYCAILDSMKDMGFSPTTRGFFYSSVFLYRADIMYMNSRMVQEVLRKIASDYGLKYSMVKNDIAHMLKKIWNDPFGKLRGLFPNKTRFPGVHQLLLGMLIQSTAERNSDAIYRIFLNFCRDNNII